MFENAFLEASSKIHPSVPFLFYCPIVIGLLAWGLTTGITDWPRVAIFGGLGYLVWCWMEYVIHRVLMHWEGNGPLTRKFHDIIHGYHHQYPDDALRLVMPLGASIPLAIVVAALLYAVGRPSATVPIFCGIVVGYMVYDFMHWSTHARKPLTAWGKALRSHHMSHHFADNTTNFGISHRWVDALMGTLRRRAPTTPAVEKTGSDQKAA